MSESGNADALHFGDMVPVFALRCFSLEEFLALVASSADTQAEMECYEHALIKPGQFTVQGHCIVCERTVEFLVDYSASYETWKGMPVPNWREVITCPMCNLNNRMRASVAYLLDGSDTDDVIYLTESTTALYAAVKGKRPNVIGSEFLGSGTPSGLVNKDGIRHEDVTRLSFASEMLDAIGTFDVFEHVPDYKQAISELYRCLRFGGLLVVTVPINLYSKETVTRATVDDLGIVTHLMEPEIHDNPLDPSGSLCFYHYGWDFIAELRGIGFQDVGVSLYWNPKLGFLGGYQAIISGHKAIKK